MKRGDAAVIWISAALAAVVVAGVVFSLRVLDRRPGQPAGAAANSTASLLVMTWGPSLCRLEPANRGCRSGHVGRLGQTFVLHGLWPQPSTEQYCGVPSRVSDNARSPVELPDDIKAVLQKSMSDSGRLATHEWYAHGTCSGVTPPEYFDIASTLADQAAGVINPVFGSSAGRQVSSRALREAFDTRFGKGSGRRVMLSCRPDSGGDIVYEVRLSLPPVVDLRPAPQLSLADALAKGPTVSPGCGQGRVP